MKSNNERDSHFFLAGWNGARRDVDATEHFQNASKTAPTSCLHQIQEPTVNQQLTIELEAFEKWLGIKPCGAAHDFGWAAWKDRAALSATPEAVKQSLTTDAVLPEPVEFQCRVKPDWDEKHPWTDWEKCKPESASDYLKNPTLHNWTYEVRKLFTEQQVRALLATGGQVQAVASIYVTEDGQRECDDWKVPLPVGRNLLYAAPQAQADARCVSCNYQHGHAIGCENNPVDIALKNNAAAIAAAKGEA